MNGMDDYPSWSPLDPTENPILTVVMADAVVKQGAAPIVSATVAVTVAAGRDPNASQILPGACTVSLGNTVSVQKASNTGVPGTRYLATFTAITQAGEVIVGTVGLRIKAGGA